MPQPHDSQMMIDDFFLWQTQGIINTNVAAGSCLSLLRPMLSLLKKQPTYAMTKRTFKRCWTKREADQPYGDKNSQLQQVIDFGVQLELLECGGAEKHSTVALTDQGKQLMS
jgi:hypothetical protein